MPKDAGICPGDKFGKLTVQARVESANHNRRWRCVCDCGREKIAPTKLLKNGAVKSCGCLQGLGYNRTHGLGDSPEMNAWRDARRRCHNPTNKGFRYYGGRGIVMCDRWRNSFQAFYDDMGLRPSADHMLDRTDNDGPYSPDNCRWVTRREQMNNRRNTRWLTYNGETKPLAVWARQMGIRMGTLRARLDQSEWSVERALTE